LKQFAIGLVAIAAIAATGLPAYARSTISIHNDTADAWVWVSNYVEPNGSILPGQDYCLGPHESRSNSYRLNVSRVWERLTTKENCGFPVVHDATFATKMTPEFDRTFSGIIYERNGKYYLTSVSH
jgi:hypothetical protein